MNEKIKKLIFNIKYTKEERQLIYEHIAMRKLTKRLKG